MWQTKLLANVIVVLSSVVYIQSINNQCALLGVVIPRQFNVLMELVLLAPLQLQVIVLQEQLFLLLLLCVVQRMVLPVMDWPVDRLEVAL